MTSVLSMTVPLIYTDRRVVLFKGDLKLFETTRLGIRQCLLKWFDILQQEVLLVFVFALYGALCLLDDIF